MQSMPHLYVVRDRQEDFLILQMQTRRAVRQARQDALKSLPEVQRNWGFDSPENEAVREQLDGSVRYVAVQSQAPDSSDQREVATHSLVATRYQLGWGCLRVAQTPFDKNNRRP